MAKKVAVLAVNPVNGCGLFQYLEAFFENGISYKVFAVSNSKEIRTNSGIALVVDDVIANLKGHEDDFDMAGAINGKMVAVHPLAKPAIQGGKATDNKSEIDGNIYTAQDENSIWTMMSQVLDALK